MLLTVRNAETEAIETDADIEVEGEADVQEEVQEGDDDTDEMGEQL